MFHTLVKAEREKVVVYYCSQFGCVSSAELLGKWKGTCVILAVATIVAECGAIMMMYGRFSGRSFEGFYG